MTKRIQVFLVFLLSFILFLTTSSAQTWQALMDSTKFNKEKRDYQTSLNWAKLALKHAEKEFGKNDTNYASTLGTLSELYYYLGNLDSAICYGETKLILCRTILKGDHPELAMSINNMAVFYNEIGNYKQCEPLFKEAHEMYRRLFKDDNPDLASCINNMASFYNDRGDYKIAEPLYNEALNMYRHISKGDNSDLATIINNIALFYNKRGDYKQAEPLYKEALEMRRRIFKGDHPDLAITINNMASFYEDKGDFSKAEPLYKEALEMRRRIFKGDNAALAQSLNNIACFYNGRGNYNQSEPLYKESLEMFRRIFKSDHPDLAQSINNMAVFYNDRGNYKLAEPLYKEALEVYKNMLNNYFPSLSETEKKLFWNSVCNNFESFNSFAVKRASKNPAILSNIYDIQLYTKALLFNSTSKIKKRIINSNDTALIDKYKELTDSKELLVKQYTMTEFDRKKKGFNTDLLEKMINDLEKELSLKSEIYTQSYDKKKVTWKTIQAVLKPDEAAVEVIRFRFKERNKFTDTINYAFLIVSENTEDYPDFVVLENGNLLENEYYSNYRKMIKQKTEDKSSFDNYWGKLYDKLKGYKKIYFSADGIYNKLNPATLLLPNGKYLLEEQDIQQVNSTKDLLMEYYQTKQESNIYNSAVLVGNPNFALSESQVIETSKKIRENDDEDFYYEGVARPRGIELTRLPGTEKEVKDIEKFLKSKNWVVNCYLGDNAIKMAVKAANNPRILHIATHGMFLEDVSLENKVTFGFETKKIIDNPLLRSGLFFSGADNYLKSDSANSAGDINGLLTAYEAMNLDLDRTELVVLSACETGLGEVKNGEGVFGLRRAFQQAGAKAVVMSLWAVNDESTQKLMSSFYKNWITGMTKREAFSKAQQEIKSKYKDPYYWGAFVMVGE